MSIKNITKFVTIALCAVMINTSYINNVNEDDHTPKRKLINELKEEITELGGTPVKRKHFDKYEKNVGKKHLDDTPKVIETKNVKVEL